MSFSLSHILFPNFSRASLLGSFKLIEGTSIFFFFSVNYFQSGTCRRCYLGFKEKILQCGILAFSSNLWAPGENVSVPLTLCWNGTLMNDLDYILINTLESDCLFIWTMAVIWCLDALSNSCGLLVIHWHLIRAQLWTGFCFTVGTNEL